MWKCELCNKKCDDKETAVEIRFGYVDSDEIKKGSEQYNAFYTDNAFAPLCDDCAIAYIKGKKG